MPTYRIYFFDEGAQSSKPPTILECANNEEAIRKARDYVEGEDLELWRDGTLIANFPRKGNSW